MTCKHGTMKDGRIVCTKGYPVQLMKCLGRGKKLPCYQERDKDES